MGVVLVVVEVAVVVVVELLEVVVVVVVVVVGEVMIFPHKLVLLHDNAQKIGTGKPPMNISFLQKP